VRRGWVGLIQARAVQNLGLNSYSIYNVRIVQVYGEPNKQDG